MFNIIKVGTVHYSKYVCMNIQEIDVYQQKEIWEIFLVHREEWLEKH